MTDGRRMDDGPWLYYKLTDEPKGSGELKMDENSTINTLTNAKHDSIPEIICILLES